MKHYHPLSLALDDEDRAAHLERLRLIMKPFPRIRLLDTCTRSYLWSGCGIGIGSTARRPYDENDNR